MILCKCCVKLRKVFFSQRSLLVVLGTLINYCDARKNASDLLRLLRASLCRQAPRAVDIDNSLVTESSLQSKDSG